MCRGLHKDYHIFGGEMRRCDGTAKQCVLRGFGHVKGMDKYRLMERIMLLDTNLRV